MAFSSQYAKQQQNLADLPHLHRWFDSLRDRAAVQRAYSIELPQQN